VDSAWEQNAKRLEAMLREMLAADWASELPANIAQPERMSAGHSPASSTYTCPGAVPGSSWCSCRSRCWAVFDLKTLYMLID